jgi:hypothetical protein
MYCDLMDRVVKALPKNLRNEIAAEAKKTSGYKYHGPTRQLRLIDNPATFVLAVAAGYEERLRKSKQVQLELFIECLGERERAMRAEEYFLECALLLGVLHSKGMIWVDYERVDQVMKKLAITWPSFIPAQAWLLAKARQRIDPQPATLGNQMRDNGFNNEPMPR